MNWLNSYDKALIKIEYELKLLQLPRGQQEVSFSYKLKYPFSPYIKSQELIQSRDF